LPLSIVRGALSATVYGAMKTQKVGGGGW